MIYLCPMIKKFPSVIKFNDYKELFSTVDFKSLIKLKIADFDETMEMSKVRNEIIESLEKNQELFNHLESLMVKYKRLFIIENIDNHMRINTQVDTKSLNKNEYRTAKVMFPQVGGEDVGVRVSLGRIVDIKKRKLGPSEEDYQKVKKSLLKKM